MSHILAVTQPKFNLVSAPAIAETRWFAVHYWPMLDSRLSQRCKNKWIDEMKIFTLWSVFRPSVQGILDTGCNWVTHLLMLFVLNEVWMNIAMMEVYSSNIKYNVEHCGLSEKENKRLVNVIYCRPPLWIVPHKFPGIICALRAELFFIFYTFSLRNVARDSSCISASFTVPRIV